MLRKDLIHFGIANTIQQTYDADLYAIVESYDKPKKFFQNQNLVNFKKTWYLDNLNVQNKKPDIEYLKTKESEYGINIWQFAYSERYFLNFNKYYKFSSEEILTFFEEEFRFFESIFGDVNPDFVITTLPDYHHIKLFCELCKKKNINLLILSRSKFSLNHFLISQEPHKIDITEKNPKIFVKTISDIKKLHTSGRRNQLKEISNQRQGFAKMLRRNALRSIFKLFMASGKDNERERFLERGRSRIKLLTKTISVLLKVKYRDFFIDKYLLKSVIPHKKFVYFPLHLEPEEDILMGAPFYTNQIEIIKNIAKSLPADYVLYAKEHPIQRKLNWRPISFYKQLLELPNVTLIHPDVANAELIEKCSLVFTIGGSAGLEASFFQKPSIIFGKPHYSKLPSAFKVDNLNDLPSLIRIALNTKFNESDLVDLVNDEMNNSFEFDTFELIDKFNPFYGTMLSNVEITEEQMKNFLDKNKKLFEKLAYEHVKKITSLKENHKS